MFSEWVLGWWTGAGIVWWLIALGLVLAQKRRDGQAMAAGKGGSEILSIFKPLPPLGPGGMEPFARGLESFIGQGGERSELLLGIHEADREISENFVTQMRKTFPEAELKIIYRSTPDDVANPKIAWLKILAEQARGDLWLWSDADIIAPMDFIGCAREEFTEGGAGMLTFPYVVREVASAPAFLDALFVNAELYPGVLLLRRLGPVDFGLGAGMLFRRDDFLRKVKWEEIGSALADDFVLGRALRPVRISAITLETRAEVGSWRDAWGHHLRWSKTIRWNRPVGSMSQILVLPVLGWLGYALFHPAVPGGWFGLLAMMQMDVLFAAAICRTVGCQFTLMNLLTMEGWSIWRVLVWLACWLPWPVVWRGRRWRGPLAEGSRAEERTA